MPFVHPQSSTLVNNAENKKRAFKLGALELTLEVLEVYKADGVVLYPALQTLYSLLFDSECKARAKTLGVAAAVQKILNSSAYDSRVDDVKDMGAKILKKL